MTVTLARNAATPAKYRTRAQLDGWPRGYYRRLLQLKAWVRFLTFQSHYDVVWSSMKRLIVKQRAPKKVPPPSDPAAIEQ